MLKVVRSFTASAEDFHDLFQEILLQIWISMPKYRGEAKVSSWIYRVALNKALTWDLAEEKRRERHLPLVELPELQAPDDDRVLLDSLYAAIRTLKEVDRSLVLLHLDGFTYEEIAAILGMTQSNVGVRIMRAKAALAKRLEEEE